MPVTGTALPRSTVVAPLLPYLNPMWLLLGLAFLAPACSLSTPPSDSATTSNQVARSQAKEWGAVQWQQRLEPALTASAQDQKPVLLLFQEVPG